MNLYNHIAFLILSLGLLGCEKEQTSITPIQCEATIQDVDIVDTLFPSEYFPAYPDSYWKMNTVGGMAYEIKVLGWKTDTTYIPVSLEGCGTFKRQITVVPKLSAQIFGDIWGDKVAINPFDVKFGKQAVNLFNPVAGSDKIYPVGDNYYMYTESIVYYQYDSLQLDNIWYHDVLVTAIRYARDSHFGIYYPVNTSYYFSKHVGLIGLQHVSWGGSLITLDSCYIAPH